VKIRLLKNGESGQALIAALILLALGYLLVVPTLGLASTSLKYHHRIETNTLESYAADSGVQYAMCRLGNNPGEFGPETLPSEVNDRTVNVTADYTGNNIYKITSTATSDSGSSTTIEAFVSVTASLLDYAMLATDGNINLSGNSEITSSPVLFEGDIYANGNITLSGNAEVQGDATATGEINTSGNATITGAIEDLAPPLEFPEVDTSIYLDEAEQGALIDGDLNISGTGDYVLEPAHITGDLYIGGSYRIILQGAVYVDGSITMEGLSMSFFEAPYAVVAEGPIIISANSTIKLPPEGIPLIISTNGDITVTGGGWVSAILYAPNGDIILSGNSKVCGALVGRNIYAEGNNEVEYSADIKGRHDLPGGGGVNILSYTFQG